MLFTLANKPFPFLFQLLNSYFKTQTQIVQQHLRNILKPPPLYL